MAAKIQYIVTCVCVLLFVALTEAQSTSFGLHQAEFNEVIFVGEMNINMTCTSSRSSIIEITIEHGGTVIANTQGLENYLRYNIETVTLKDGGYYKCSIIYTTGATLNTTELKNIYLNVHDNKSPQCINNGTDDDYKVGDILLLTCYCLLPYTCGWIETFVDSGNGKRLSIFETHRYTNKLLITVLVGPFALEEDNKEFYCYHGESANERCAVGPLHFSTLSSTGIVSEQPYTSHITLRKRSDSSSSHNNETTSSYFISTSVTTENLKSHGILPLWIIGAVVFSFVVIIPILVFVVFILKRRKKKNNNNTYDKTTGNNDDKCNNMTFTNHSEDAYAFQTGDVSHYGISKANVHNVEITSLDTTDEVLDKSKLYSTVNKDKRSEIKEMNIQHYETNGEDVQDLYAKVDKNRHMSNY